LYLLDVTPKPGVQYASRLVPESFYYNKFSRDQRTARVTVFNSLAKHTAATGFAQQMIKYVSIFLSLSLLEPMGQSPQAES
jgi:hypothetical protein